MTSGDATRALKRYGVKEIFDTVQGEGSRSGARSVFLRFTGCNAWNGRTEDRAKGKGECARWCDTDFVGGEVLGASEILQRLEALWSGKANAAGYLPERWVVISGGEPALQLDTALVTELHRAGWSIAVETNGSVNNAVLYRVDHLTVSPKRGMPLLVSVPEDSDAVTELKVVLPGTDRAGEGWTDVELGELASAGGRGWDHLFVQPMDPIDQRYVETSFLHRNLKNRQQGALPQFSPDIAPVNVYRGHLKRCLSFVREHTEWRISLQQHKLMDVR